jgi:hypothetical protein
VVFLYCDISYSHHISGLSLYWYWVCHYKNNKGLKKGIGIKDDKISEVLEPTSPNQKTM